MPDFVPSQWIDAMSLLTNFTLHASTVKSKKKKKN